MTSLTFFEGEADLQASLPLSRFVGNQTSIQLEFAIGGTEGKLQYEVEVIMTGSYKSA